MANGDGKWVWNLNELDFFLVVMDMFVAGKSMWLAGSELGFLEQEPSRGAQLVHRQALAIRPNFGYEWYESMLYRCAHNLVLCIWLEFSFMQIVKVKIIWQSRPLLTQALAIPWRIIPVRIGTPWEKLACNPSYCKQIAYEVPLQICANLVPQVWT